MRILYAILLLHATMYCSETQSSRPPEFNNSQFQMIAALLEAQRQGLDEIDRTFAELQLDSVETGMLLLIPDKRKNQQPRCNLVAEATLKTCLRQADHCRERREIFYNASQAAIMLLLREINSVH